MERWNEPDSILAPLIAAVPPGTRWAGFTSTLSAAAGSVPVAAAPVTYKRANSFRSTQGTVERRLLAQVGDKAEPFTARICHFRRMRDATEPSPRTAFLWELGLSELKDGLCAPAVPADWTCALLQVTLFRLRRPPHLQRAAACPGPVPVGRGRARGRPGRCRVRRSAPLEARVVDREHSHRHRWRTLEEQAMITVSGWTAVVIMVLGGIAWIVEIAGRTRKRAERRSEQRRLRQDFATPPMPPRLPYTSESGQATDDSAQP